MFDLTKRLEKIYETIDKRNKCFKYGEKIRGRVKNQMEKTQREYYLNEQLKSYSKRTRRN